MWLFRLITISVQSTLFNSGGVVNGKLAHIKITFMTCNLVSPRILPALISLAKLRLPTVNSRNPSSISFLQTLINVRTKETVKRVYSNPIFIPLHLTAKCFNNVRANGFLQFKLTFIFNIKVNREVELFPLNDFQTSICFFSCFVCSRGIRIPICTNSQICTFRISIIYFKLLINLRSKFTKSSTDNNTIISRRFHLFKINITIVC